MEKGQSFQQMCWSQSDLKSKLIDINFTFYTKMNSEWLVDVNEFLDMTPKVQTTKEKQINQI